MSFLSVRPRFEQVVEREPDALRVHLVDRISQDFPAFEVKSFPGFICLLIPEAERHFWSPRLHLSLEADDDQHTLVHGIYEPNADVWSLFVFGGLSAGFVAVVSAILVICQCLIGLPPWGFWPLGLALIAGGALFLTAHAGRHLGAAQTNQLHEVYQSAIGQPVEIR